MGGDDVPYASPVVSVKVRDRAHLEAELKQVTDANGEVGAWVKPDQAGSESSEECDTLL